MRGMTLQELVAWTPPFQKYVISSGILVPGTKMIIFGRFQTWKSMLSIHTAFTIANGLPWFGYKTTKTPTYYLQVEVPQTQLRERVLKYTIGNKVVADNVWLATEPYIKLDKGFGLAAIDGELSRTQAKLLIVDPIYKVVSGHMTDEWDMRQFMDRMDLLMDKYKFSLILIHHDRKHLIQDGVMISCGAEDMFGSSIFIDWVDTAVRSETNDNDGELILTFEKARHAQEELKPLTIQIDRATLRFNKKEG